MDSSENLPIEFFDHLNEIKEQISQRILVFFLDYDGTLTPIVATPDLALLSAEMKTVISQLSLKFKTAIVSGRATEDVHSKVKIKGLFYAGSHGFEILYPEGSVKINEEAQKIRPIIDEVHQKISARVSSFEGALVEHVKYTISVHYRQLVEQHVRKVEEIVDEVLKEYPQLKKGKGKKVFELKPKLDWHKGKAVDWIFRIFQNQMEEGQGQILFPIYIGDDTTDEDAFRYLKDKGAGILVAEEARASAADYFIKDTEEVKRVLEWFLKG